MIGQSQSCSSINNISKSINIIIIFGIAGLWKHQKQWQLKIQYRCLYFFFIILFYSFEMTILRLTSLLTILILVETITGLSLMNSVENGCLKYQFDECVKCHDDYYLHMGQCHKIIEGCISYQIKDGNRLRCVECDHSYFLMEDSGACFPNALNKQLNNTRILQLCIQETCGQNLTAQATQENIKNNPYFRLVDSYMLNGDYKHFITRSPVYIKSVDLEYDSLDANFKIIYFGSGGGLMQCIISINILTKAIQLRSFVLIDGGYLVDRCLNYGSDHKCKTCEKGYHLQTDICYRSIENCLRHIRNICIECKGYSLLLENRCITACRETSDTNKMRMFGDVRLLAGNALPVLEQSYLLKCS